MLLTITTTHQPASDLGYLLHKHPDRCQSVELTFGSVHVFYPQATEDISTIAVLLDISPVELVKSRKSKGRPGTVSFDHYINDRPYVCSSFMSVAISQVFRSALNGQCKLRPELVPLQMPLHCKISLLPCISGENFLRGLFEPLGYQVAVQGYPLDTKFPQWGDSPYFTVELIKTTTVSELLNHLYVLIPVLDNQKHYYIDTTEIEKLLKHGEGWLKDHPKKEVIARRYLKYQRSYTQELLDRLDIGDIKTLSKYSPEEEIETKINLDEQRRQAILEVLTEREAGSVIDMGCGEGKLLLLLLNSNQFKKIAGLDVSARALEKAARNLEREVPDPAKRRKVELIRGSMLYRDRRCQGFDAVVLMEVIEHLDPSRLPTFERLIFDYARPKTIIITTPNKEYNKLWENLPPGQYRHRDHRFEWTREEFSQWAQRVCREFGYEFRIRAIGPEDQELGPPSQMGIFFQIKENN